MNRPPFLALALLLAVALPANAAWAPNGNPVCTATASQRGPLLLADGLGGVYVAWVDGRAGTFQNDVYLQRLDGGGIVQFAPDGVPVCAAAGDQLAVAVARDGFDGVLLAWEDRRDAANVEVYAQRVGTDGLAFWTADGVNVSQASGGQGGATIVSDGRNGAIVAWEDGRSGTCRAKDVYVRRVDSRGVPQWAASGVPVCTALDDQDKVRLVADGANGSILAWSDRRGEVRDVYAQRVDGEGAVQWIANGAIVCDAPDRQTDLALAPAPAGGALVAWNDWRSGSFAVHAQALSAAGAPQWIHDGVACGAEGSGSPPAVVADAGGWLVAMSVGSDIRLQRLDPSGAPQWGPEGVAVCTAAGTQARPALVPDGLGGAIVAWADYRAGNADIYAQRIGPTGAPAWTADGVLLCNAAGSQENPAIASDGVAGAIVAWEDPRDGAFDLYAQRISSLGEVGATGGVEPPVPAGIGLAPARPNPSAGPIELSLTLAAPSRARVELFDAAGRAVRTLWDGWAPAGVTPLRWDGRDGAGRPAPSGVYHARATAGARTAVARIERVR